jgi:hypothetical protein
LCSRPACSKNVLEEKCGCVYAILEANALTALVHIKAKVKLMYNPFPLWGGHASIQ